MDNKSYPLTGIKVLELSSAVAAPTAARIMSSFGARVIKIETPPHGDILRPMAAAQMQRSSREENPVFDIFNSGKSVVALNLKSEAGQEIMDKLLSQADVFITNVRLRSLEGMGLDYPSLQDRFPQLIYAHLSGFGLRGPDVNRPGFDATAFWMRSGGSTDMVEPGAYPLLPSFAFGDITSASAFLSGILMGIVARDRTGRGTLISTSLFATGIWSSASYIIESQGSRARQFPNSHYESWDPFSCFYRCADGEWIAFMEKSYAADRKTFARILDMPELLEDPDLECLEAMARAGKALGIIRRVEEIVSTRPAGDWKRILDENDIANEIAQHYRDIPKDPQAEANGFLDRVCYYGDEEYAIPAPPIEFSEYGRKPLEKAGAIGQDTKEVLLGLGYGEDEIAALYAQKIVM